MRLVVLSFAAAGLAACASTPAPPSVPATPANQTTSTAPATLVSGVVRLQGGGPIPAGAIVTVIAQDFEPMSARPPTALGTAQVVGDGVAVVRSFDLSLDKAAFAAAKNPQLRARLDQDGVMLAATGMSIPMAGPARPSAFELILEPMK